MKYRLLLGFGFGLAFANLIFLVIFLYVGNGIALVNLTGLLGGLVAIYTSFRAIRLGLDNPDPV